MVPRVFLSQAWSLNFGMNNNNLREGYRVSAPSSALLGSPSLSTHSQDFYNMLDQGEGSVLLSLTSLNFHATVWNSMLKRLESFTMCFLFRKLYFISPVRFSKSLSPCNLTNSVVGCGIITFSSEVWYANSLTEGQGWAWVFKGT